MKNKTIHILIGLIITLTLTQFAADKEPMNRKSQVRVFSGETQVKDLNQVDFQYFKNTTRRFFILHFQLNQFNPQVKQSTAHVFNHLLNPGDKVLISIADRVLYFDPLSDKVKAFGVLETILREQAAWSKQQMLSEIDAMNKFIDDVRIQAKQDVHKGATYGNWWGVHPHYYMKYLKNSIERYLDMLLGYKEKFLLPNAVKLARLFDHFSPIKSEKYYISFYQMPVLPTFSRQNRKMIKDWIKELSIRGWLDELDYTRKLGRLQADIDDVFKISDKDYDNLYYEIAKHFYAPPSPNLTNPMKQVAAGISDLRIEDLSFKKKILYMIIKGFAKDEDKKNAAKKQGKLNVLVRIIDPQGKVVFNKKKALLAQKESISLSLDFKWLKKGKYFLITDAKDLITGKAWAQISGLEIY
jgi:hypothetical protein